MKNVKVFLFVVMMLALVVPTVSPAASFDGDANPDLILTVNSNAGTRGEVQWWEKDAVTGVVGMTRIVGFGSNVWETCASGDLDGDGYTDLLVGSQNQINWYEARSDNTATLVDRFDIGATYDLQFYGNDVYAAKEGGIVKVTSSGDNTAVASSIVSHSATYKSVLATDFDSDGKVELFAGWQTNPTATTGQIDLYEENGSFSKISTFITAPGGSEFISGNYDGDNDEDVFLSWGYAAGSSVAWYETDGTDNGLTMKQRQQYVRAEELEMADLDGDGKMELVVSNNGNGESTDAWEATGDDTWVRNMRPNQYRASSALSAGDWDSDGDVDLIYGSFDDTNTFGLYWGEASGDNIWAGNGYISQYLYTGSDSVMIVPEPATMVLLLTGAAGLLVRKRK